MSALPARRYDPLDPIRDAVADFAQWFDRLEALGFPPTSHERRMWDRGGAAPTPRRDTHVPSIPRGALLVARALPQLAPELRELVLVKACLPGADYEKWPKLRISRSVYYRRWTGALWALHGVIGQEAGR